MTESKRPQKVFISYAWEDDINPWVNELATRLRSDSVNAILDQWELALGDQLTQFMEQSVRESDFVVFICTPIYKRKSDNRKGGVGYEGGIITGEVFAKNNHRKFIPILRKGKWSESAPSWATSKLYIDLSGNPYSDVNYQQLLDTLLGRLPAAPPVKTNTLPGIEEGVNEERPVLQSTYNEIKTNIEFGLYKDAYKKCVSLLSQGDDGALINLLAAIAYALDKGIGKLLDDDMQIINKHISLTIHNSKVHPTALAMLGCIKFEYYYLNKVYDPSSLTLEFIKKELQETETAIDKELLNLINPAEYALDFLDIE